MKQKLGILRGSEMVENEEREQIIRDMVEKNDLLSDYIALGQSAKGAIPFLLESRDMGLNELFDSLNRTV